MQAWDPTLMRGSELGKTPDRWEHQWEPLTTSWQTFLSVPLWRACYLSQGVIPIHIILRVCKVKDVFLEVCSIWNIHFFQKDFLFLERGEGKEKERETSMCGCLSSTPYWGPGPQPRHVPWLGIEPATLWLAGRHSVHWATPARVKHSVF